MKKSTPTSTILRSLVLCLIVLVVASVSAAAAYFVSDDNSVESIISSIATISLTIAPVLFAIPVYYQVRKFQNAHKSEVTTTLIVSIGLTLAYLVDTLLLAPFLVERTTSMPFAFGTAALSFVITFVLSLLGSAIAKKIYQARHSIITE